MNHDDNNSEKLPVARYGHTITTLNKKMAVLFGGSICGDNGKSFMAGETFIYCTESDAWTEINGKTFFLFI